MTVVLISCIVALVVCGVAIGLSWNFAFQQAKKELSWEASMVLNAVTSFSVQQAQNQAVRELNFELRKEDAVILRMICYMCR